MWEEPLAHQLMDECPQVGVVSAAKVLPIPSTVTMSLQQGIHLVTYIQIYICTCTCTLYIWFIHTEITKFKLREGETFPTITWNTFMQNFMICDAEFLTHKLEIFIHVIEEASHNSKDKLIETLRCQRMITLTYKFCNAWSLLTWIPIAAKQ